MDQKKRCTKCGRLLPLTSFHKHKPSKDGRKPRCKDCRCAYSRKYRQDHKEERRVYDKRYYQENIERIRVHTKQYREEHKEEISARDAEYRRQNRERLRAYFREHYQKNREKKLEWAKVYAQNNKDRIRDYQAWYRQENKEELYSYARKNRQKHRDRYRYYGLAYIARKNRAEGKYTYEQWVELCAFFDGQCSCCREEVESFQADHIRPLTWEESTNWITNIQPLCKPCNTGKGNHHDTDYRPEHVKEWAEQQVV